MRITVSYVLAYIASTKGYSSAKVTILADNDYYSQSCSNYGALRSLPRFNHLGIPISRANKTGLGSSAALITALACALLAFYTDIDISSEKGKCIVHNLAQVAHCAAQGKVGSGFDIAAAVYGSCIYRRFDPKILEHILLDSSEYDYEFSEKLHNLVDGTWDMEVTPVQLPSGLRVVMGDVAAGSATPSMVRSVLKWKETSSSAKEIWPALGLANRQLIEQFNCLRHFSRNEIVETLKVGVDRLTTGSNTSGPIFSTIAMTFEVLPSSAPLMTKNIRNYLQTMGNESNVPIEPSTQTELIQETLCLKGSLIAGVPGAGGYDAIFCMVVDDGEGEGSAFRRLLTVWESWKVRVCPLLAREENFGMKTEDVEALSLYIRDTPK